MEGSITLYIGCMYSGKTTALFRKLSIYSEMGLRCLYINSSLDNRTNTDFSTHNPLITSSDFKKIDTIKILNLFSTQVVKTNNGIKLAKDLTEDDEILDC